MGRKLLSRLAPRPSRVVVVAVLASLAFSAAAMAAAGDLDPTFSGDGKQTTDFGSGASTRRATVAIKRRQDRRGRLPGDFDGDDFALARYNPNGTLDTSFSGDGKQTTDFGGFNDGAATRWRSRGTARSSLSAALQQPAPGGLRPRPLQPERLARHELLRRRQAVDRFGATAMRRPGWRSRRRQDRRRRHAAHGGDFAARPLQPQRLARHELRRRRQADDRLPGTTRRTGGPPGRRQDRRGRGAHGGAPPATTSRSPATTRTARSTPASPATASGGPASGAPRRTAVAHPGDGKIVAVGSGSGDTTSPSPATTRTGRSTRASRETASSDISAAASRDGGGHSGERQDRRGRSALAATSPSPATTRTGRSTRASPGTASGGPTSGRLDEANGVAIQPNGRIVAAGSPSGPRRQGPPISRSPAIWGVDQGAD